MFICTLKSIFLVLINVLINLSFLIVVRQLTPKVLFEDYGSKDRIPLDKLLLLIPIPILLNVRDLDYTIYWRLVLYHYLRHLDIHTT